MADLLTRGCIQKIVRGECPESFNVQLLSSRKLEGDKKFRLLLTDGQDKFALAVFDASRSDLCLPDKWSIISISSTENPSNLPKPKVVLIKRGLQEEKYSLMIHHFKVIKEGGDVGEALALLNTSPRDGVRPLLVTPPRGQTSEKQAEQPTPVKHKCPDTYHQQRGGAGAFKRSLDGLFDQQPSKVSRPDSTHEVASINPYSGKIKIKVMVESKSTVRQINTRNYSGPVQDCVLTDTSGSIKMTAWNTDVAQLDSLQEGKTYLIQTSSNKIAPVRDSRFNSTNHMFEMTWDKLNTKAVGPLTVDPVRVSYKFTKLHDLQLLPAGTEVDVLCWVSQVLDVVDRRSADGRELRMREVLLTDDSAGGASVSLVLWNAQTDHFNHNGKTIAIRRATLKDYKGAKNLNLGRNSSYEVSPDCPGAEELRDWAEGLTRGPGLGTLHTGSDQNNSGASCPVYTIQDIKDLLAQDNSEKKFTVYGFPIKINTDKMWYRAHKPRDGKVCRKKVEPSSSGDNSYSCRCGDRNLSESDTEMRFMVNLCIADSTSHVWAMMFEAASLLQRTAQELYDQKKTDEKEFERSVSAANFTTMKFTVSAKVESFNGSPTLKFTLHQAERVWPGGEDGGRRGELMLAARRADILNMERELGISHQQEYGIHIHMAGQENFGS